jgi:hypothetical protein
MDVIFRYVLILRHHFEFEFTISFVISLSPVADTLLVFSLALDG